MLHSIGLESGKEIGAKVHNGKVDLGIYYNGECIEAVVVTLAELESLLKHLRLDTNKDPVGPSSTYRGCESCGADMSQPESVIREYVNKEEGDPVFSKGHFDKYKEYCADTYADLSNGHFDLYDNSDSCAACGKGV